MAAKASWASEASAINHTASFGVGEAASEEVALDSEFPCHGLPRIVGNSAALQRVLGMVRLVAPTNATVLICGETGTGQAGHCALSAAYGRNGCVVRTSSGDVHPTMVRCHRSRRALVPKSDRGIQGCLQGKACEGHSPFV